MTNAPQAMTERYITNLIRDGHNAEFRVDFIDCLDHVQDGQHCGFYFKARILNNAGEEQFANAATITMAVRRALEQHGVTFR